MPVELRINGCAKASDGHGQALAPELNQTATDSRRCTVGRAEPPRNRTPTSDWSPGPLAGRAAVKAQTMGHHDRFVRSPDHGSSRMNLVASLQQPDEVDPGSEWGVVCEVERMWAGAERAHVSRR